MALSRVADITQEVFDMIAAEMLIKADDNFTFLQQVIPQEPSSIDAGAKTVNFNQPVLPTGVYTESGRRLTEGTAITSSSKAITLGQKTLTLREYGGPDEGGTVTPFGITEKLLKMARHDMAALIGQFMRRDRNKWLDAVRRDDMLLATNVVTPDGSAEGAIGAGVPMSASYLRALNKAMKDALVPTFANGRWKLIITTKDERELKADTEVAAAFREWAMSNPIITTGQIGFYEGFDIFVDTLMPTKAVGAGSLVTGYQQVAFGPYHLGQATLMAPSIRLADDTDFGRQMRMIWVSIEAFGSLYVTDYVVRGITT